MKLLEKQEAESNCSVVNNHSQTSNRMQNSWSVMIPPSAILLNFILYLILSFIFQNKYWHFCSSWTCWLNKIKASNFILMWGVAIFLYWIACKFPYDMNVKEYQGPLSYISPTWFPIISQKCQKEMNGQLFNKRSTSSILPLSRATKITMDSHLWYNSCKKYTLK